MFRSFIQLDLLSQFVNLSEKIAASTCIFRVRGLTAINLRFIVILCPLLLGAPTICFALALGELTVKSSQRQPLRAEIEIIAATQAEIDALSVRLASSEAFADRNLPRPPHIAALEFSVGQSSTSGKPVIRVTSASPIEEPALVFLVEAFWPGSELVEEFNMVVGPSGRRDWGAVKAGTRFQQSAQPPIGASVSIEHELDPYYSNVGVFIPLTEAPMKEIEIGDETIIYRELLANIFTPRFLLVEASVYPLPVLGVYLKEQQESLFESGQISDDLNIVEALTEGFEEPYALSFFVGNVVRFASPRSRIFRAINKGYSGLLISVGDQHIKDSELIDDNWYEVEWKLKGDRRIDEIYHSWSFRIGAKIHDNPDIADVNYLGVRRELFNGRPANYAWNDNVGIDYSIYFSRQSGDIVQHQIFVEKKWPTTAAEYSLGIGLNKRIDKYSGELADDGDETRLILRPGLSF